MEGTVTISLKDYENLREKAAEKNYYLKRAAKQVKLLEKAEEVLKVEEIEPELLTEISEALEIWYG